MQKYNELADKEYPNDAPTNTMWGYRTAFRRQAWQAQMMRITAAEARDRILVLQKTRRIRTTRQVTDPLTYRYTKSHHKHWFASTLQGLARRRVL